MFSIFRSALRRPASTAPRALKPTRSLTTSITRLNVPMSSGNAKFATSRLFDVEGWVCVVTGGGTGIGLMIAQAFANNGARVYIVGRRPEALEQAAKAWGKSLLNPRGQIIPVPADVTDKASIEHLVNEISKNEKHVDVLVNNAGVSLGTSEVEKGNESAQALKDQLWNEELSDWETVYRTNVIGYFFTTAAFIPLLSAAQREGHTASVINISSMSGITRTSQHHFKYNVSKAATIHLSTLLAQELRRPGVKVRVNNIAPGIFPSEMTQGESDDKNKSNMPVPPDYGEKKGIPAGRPGRDEDMAQTALYIASNEYLYGQTVAVEGGYLLEHP
ncbi:NAD-P-binding protein [Trametes polyzona]|nr:NAD-P-binding protein [Trametes polyzona]